MRTIGKLAEDGGVGVETVRFYQRKGLLGTPPRDGGIRRYGSEDVRRLRFIRKAQKAGFTLEEIKELIDLDAGQDHHRVHELAAIRIEAVIKITPITFRRVTKKAPTAIAAQIAQVPTMDQVDSVWCCIAAHAGPEIG